MTYESPIPLAAPASISLIVRRSRFVIEQHHDRRRCWCSCAGGSWAYLAIANLYHWDDVLRTSRLFGCYCIMQTVAADC